MKLLETLDEPTLLSLATPEYEACVTIYMPMIKAGPQTRQNAIRLRDLYQQARQKLERYGADEDIMKTLLTPLENLEQNDDFWEIRDEGLMIFSSQDGLTVCRTSVDFMPQTIVDKRFYIRPALEVLDPAKNLNILLVNQRATRLVKCTANSCSEKTPPSHLRSLDAFLGHHDFEKSLQHASSPDAPHFHGHGVAGDEAHDNRYLLDYFRHIKNWVGEQPLVSTDQPLYLIGDDKNLGYFTKAAQDLPNELIVLEHHNTQDIQNEDIFSLVRKTLDEKAKQRASNDQATLAQTQHDAPDQIISGTGEIVTAAHDKKVRMLFLPPDTQRAWGEYNVEAHQTHINDKATQKVGEELFNLAAIRTLQNGGQVIVNDNLPADLNTSKAANGVAICYW